MEITVTNPNPHPDLVLVKNRAEKTSLPGTHSFWITLRLPSSREYIFFIQKGYPWVKEQNTNTWKMDFSLPNEKVTGHAAHTMVLREAGQGEGPHRPMKRIFDHRIVRGPNMYVETLDAMKNNDDEECKHRPVYYIFQRGLEPGVEPGPEPTDDLTLVCMKTNPVVGILPP